MGSWIQDSSGREASGWTGRASMDGQDSRLGSLPRLAPKGKLIAKGYGVWAVVQITSDVTACDIVGDDALLGTTSPRSWVLNWVKQQPMQFNPIPPDETTWDIELWLQMSPWVIEGLEERRQGKDFSLTLDTTVLLVDGGEPKGPRTQAYYATHPKRTSQDRIPVSQSDWGQVLQRWERGVGIPVLVPIAATEPNVDRAEVIRHLRAARQKIDGADYSGSFKESRLALELLRKLSPATVPLPREPRERDPLQRIHAVLEALYSFGSVTLHADPPIKDFAPLRAEAVALAAGTASVAKQMFVWLDR